MAERKDWFFKDWKSRFPDQPDWACPYSLVGLPAPSEEDVRRQTAWDLLGQRHADAVALIARLEITNTSQALVAAFDAVNEAWRGVVDA